MALTAEACDECTQNCLLMHKREKNPSPVATTFFKVMFGDDYSKILFLPPRFARGLHHMDGKTGELEDSSGERWTVKYSMVDGLLAFKEGWSVFSLDHELKVGDFLVFHHIMKAHFVVLMYGQSGCPELRHFGLAKHRLRETSKNHKLIAGDHIPSDVNTNPHRHPETRPSIGTRRPCEEEKVKAKTRQKHNISAATSPDVDATNTNSPTMKKSCLVNDLISDHIPSDVNTNSHRHPETRPSIGTPRPCEEEKVKEKTREKHNISAATSPDVDATNTNSPTMKKSHLVNNLISDTPTAKKLSLVNSDTGKVEAGLRSNSNDLKTPKVKSNESDGGCEKNVAVGGGGNETQINDSGKVLETRCQNFKKRPKESTVTPREPIYNNSIKKRLRGATFPVAGAKMAIKDPRKTNASGSRLHDAGGLSDSDPAGIFHRPLAKWMESIKKEMTNNGGSGRFASNTKTAGHNPVKEEMTPTFKPEPIDYDEAPLSDSSNTSFSAVMCSYQYLELPEGATIKSKVVFLRNGVFLWPILYQQKAGLKALTKGWEFFARERGIQPGDVCEFVLESEPRSRFTCNVFTVRVTQK